jgi:hypothetical protein
MPKEVGSPINTRVRDSDRRGESPGVRSDRRGHIAPHVGKGGLTNPRLRADGDLTLERSNASFPVDGDNSLKRRR